MVERGVVVEAVFREFGISMGKGFKYRFLVRVFKIDFCFV